MAHNLESKVNYIKKLELNNKEKAAEIVGLRNTLSELTAYLLSPKFHQENWVNPQDILNRIAEGEHLTQQLIDETPR